MKKRFGQAGRFLARVFTATSIGMAAPAFADEPFYLASPTNFADQVFDDLPDEYRALIQNSTSDALVTNWAIDHENFYTSFLQSLVRRNKPLLNGDFAQFADTLFNGQPCLIFSYTRPSNTLASLAAGMRLNVPLEKNPLLDEQEISLRVFFHELGHCEDTDLSNSKEEVRETVADVSAIRKIKQVNPKSNIDRVVIASRMLEGVYRNALMVERALAGQESTRKDFVHDVGGYALLDNLTNKVKGGISDSKQALFKEMIYLRYLRDYPYALPEHIKAYRLNDAVRLKNEAYELFYPSFSKKADRAYQILIKASLALKPGGFVPARP